MSSPIHHAEDLDEALHYAPPWAREQGQREPLRPAAALVRPPPSRWRIGVADDAFSGDRAMVKLQRQLALDPDAVPEPPVDDIQSLWPMALRLCAVAGVAAAVAWLVISLPGTRLLRHDVMHAELSAAAARRGHAKAGSVAHARGGGAFAATRSYRGERVTGAGRGYATACAGASAAADDSAAGQRRRGGAARHLVARFRRDRHAAQARQRCFQHRRSGRARGCCCGAPRKPAVRKRRWRSAPRSIRWSSAGSVRSAPRRTPHRHGNGTKRPSRSARLRRPSRWPSLKRRRNSAHA